MADLAQIIQSVTWTRAKTYDHTAPHEYIILSKFPEQWEYLSNVIAAEGKTESFRMPGEAKAHRYRYYYFGEHKYWQMGVVINRALINQQRPAGPFIEIPE